jgi:methionine--tRNA ligase beta chain
MEYQKIDDLRKFVIKIGTVESAEKVEGSDKLLKLIIDFGFEKRQILSGISKYFSPENLVGKQLPVVINLEPRKMMNKESQGMLMSADVEGKPVLIEVNSEIKNGTVIR